MAQWVINRPISGFSTMVIEAENVSVGSSVIMLLDRAGSAICVIEKMPGIIVVRKDAQTA